MGLHVVGMIWSDLVWILYVLEVILGLGLIIFVHELGHFVVAKLCGVKCEKFYLGFDIGGLKLWKRKWGETEYGIGILPLGGYVKMLGQEDNPGRLHEEIERAKAHAAEQGGAAGQPAGAPAQPPATDEPSADEVAAAEQALYNPRSYLAKSVPKRMAIITAGVIMNVIFAFFAAMGAYGLGLFQPDAGVGALAPGDPAWKADIQVGDDFREIGEKRVRRFSDLQIRISLGDNTNGVPVEIQRPGVKEPVEVTLQPSRGGLAPTIGVASPLRRVLDDKLSLPARPGSAADKATPALEGGDHIVGVNGRRVDHYENDNYAELFQQLVRLAGEDLELAVERPEKDQQGRVVPGGAVKALAVKVPREPVRDLGLLFALGEVTAVQSGSPAAELDAAGRPRLVPGDRIVKADGRDIPGVTADGPLDALRFPEWLRRRAGQKVVLSVIREGEAAPLTIEVTPRQPYGDAVPFKSESPLAAEALGIAYRVPAIVSAVVPKGPAAEAGIVRDDEIVAAEIEPPDPETIEKLGLQRPGRKLKPRTVSYELTGKEAISLPALFLAIQEALPQSKVTLTFKDERTATIVPAAAADWFLADRGFRFKPKGHVVQAESLADAIRLGAEETGTALGLVYRFLTKVGTQVSAKSVGGPITIAQMAYGEASKGLSAFLIFLTIISANLAVLNILPIPVLDGGHVVFLLYEGITGKPPSQRVHVILSYIGLALILALMVWALGLDFGLISRK